MLLCCIRAVWGFLWGEGSAPKSLSRVYQPHTRMLGLPSGHAHMPGCQQLFVTPAGFVVSFRAVRGLPLPQ